MNGIVGVLIRFTVLALVVIFRKKIHNEGIKSFLVHLDTRGWKLLSEGFIIGLLSFSLYPLLVVLFGFGTISYKFVSTNLILNNFLTQLFVMLMVALLEESIMRGYMLQRLMHKYSIRKAIIISTLIFALPHLLSYSASSSFFIGFINVSLVAVLWSIVIIKTNSLMFAVGFHWAWNIAQKLLLDKTLFNFDFQNNFFTGGSRTPETSILTVGILGIFGLYIGLRFRKLKLKKPDIIVNEGIIVKYSIKNIIKKATILIGAIIGLIISAILLLNIFSVKDNVNIAFENDKDIIGVWKSVDLINNIEDFTTETGLKYENLFFKGFNISEGGMTDSYFTWTKGFIINKSYETASKYLIKTVGNSKYLIFEWKLGDYKYFHKNPQYYVLKKAD